MNKDKIIDTILGLVIASAVIHFLYTAFITDSQEPPVAKPIPSASPTPTVTETFVVQVPERSPWYSNPDPYVDENQGLTNQQRWEIQSEIQSQMKKCRDFLGSKPLSC